MQPEIVTAGAASCRADSIAPDHQAAADVVASVYREHRIILGLVAGYIAIGGLALTAFGRPWPIKPTNVVFAVIWTAASALWLC